MIIAPRSRIFILATLLVIAGCRHRPPVADRDAPITSVFNKSNQGLIVAYLPAAVIQNGTQFRSSLGVLSLEDVDLLVISDLPDNFGPPKGMKPIFSDNHKFQFFTGLTVLRQSLASKTGLSLTKTGLNIPSRSGPKGRPSVKSAWDPMPKVMAFTLKTWNGSQILLETFTAPKDGFSEPELDFIARHPIDFAGPRLLLGPLGIEDSSELEMHRFERLVLPHWLPANALAAADQQFSVNLSKDLYDGLKGWRLNRKSLRKSLAKEIVFELLPATGSSL